MNPIKAGEDLLPTIGNVAGSVFGAGIGGAAATPADVIGGPVPTIAGGIAGAGAGGALGQEGGAALRDFLQGKQHSAGDVLGNLGGGAVSGAAGEGIGGLLSKVFGGVAKATAKPVMDIADQAYKKLADYAKPLQDALSGYQKGTDTRINNNFMGDKTGGIEGSTANFMNKLGVGMDHGGDAGKMAGQWRQAANAIVTHLNGAMQKVLGDAPQIADPALKQALNNAALKGHIDPGLIKAGTGGEGGEAVSIYNPQTIFKAIQKLENNVRVGTSKTNVTMTPDQAVQQEAKSAAAKQLKDLLFNQAGVSERVAAHQPTAEDLAAIEKDTQGMPQVGQFIKDALQNTQTGPELRGAQAPAVQADNIAKEVINRLKLGKDVPIEPQHQFEALAQGVGDVALGGAKGAIGVGAKLASKAAGGVMPAVSKTASMLGKIPFAPWTTGSLSLLGNAAAAKPEAGSSAGAPPGATLASNRQPAGGGGQQAVNPISDVYNQEQGAQNALAMQAFRAGPAMGGPFAGAEASLGGTLGQVAPILQQQEQAQHLMGGLPQAYQNAPTGLMGAVQGMIPGTAANAYQQQAQTTAAVLSRLLGISPQQAMGLVPQLINPAAAPGREQMSAGLLGGMQ